MAFQHAIIGPDTSNSWTWATEKLVGIPAVIRVLITLYRVGVKQVFLPAEAHAVRQIVDTWQKKKDMPQCLWEDSDKQSPFSTGSDTLYIQGGIIFEAGLVQWLQQAAPKFPEGNLCVKGRNDQIVLVVLRGTDDAEEFCSQNPASVVSAPAELFCRSVAELKATGNDRALLEMVGKPEEAGHVKWIRNKTFPLIRFLSETRVSPNQLTWFGFLLGITGACFIAQGEYLSGVIGALLLCGSWILDGLDGTLARLTFAESPRGEKLDTTLGHLTNIAFFIALVWAVYGTVSLVKAGLFTFIMVLSIAVAHRICQAEKQIRDRTHPDRQIKRVQIFLERINGRDFAVLILLFALFDGFKFFLWGSLAGIQVFWLVHLWLILRHRR